MPVVFANVPGGVSEQLLAPVDGLYWPRAQGWQLDDAAWPVRELLVPAGQAVQVPEPLVSLNVPEGHVVHVAAPDVGLNAPAAQSVQADETLDPIALLLVPGGQRIQVASAGLAPYVPRGHGVHVEECSSEKVPGQQGVQPQSPAVEYVPTGQIPQKP